MDPHIYEQKLTGEWAMLCLFFHITRHFRELEKSEGITQTELGRRMGLTQAQVSRWFASPTNMTIRTAGELICAMGLPLGMRLYDPYQPLTVEQIAERERRAALYREEIREVEGEFVRIPVRIENPSGTAD